MYTSSPIEFHIICDKAAQDYLEKRLRLISRPSHNIFVRFYLLSWSNMLGRLEREGAIVTDHSAGVRESPFPDPRAFTYPPQPAS